MARVLVAFANKSSMDMSRRITRKHRQLAEQGKFGGGGKTPYGFEDDRVTINPGEAEIIREMAQRVLAGESLASICKSLDARGVRTRTGIPWRRTVVKSILLTPRIAGLRIYRNSLLLDDNGEPVRGQWEPILDVPTWEAVGEILTNPERNSHRGVDRKYLLSGFLRCKCGERMYGVARKGVRHYICHPERGCGNTYRRAEPIEEHITELVLRYLEREAVDSESISSEVALNMQSIDRSIAEAEKSLAALINEWNEGRMSDQVFFAAQGKREATLTALRRQRAKSRKIHAPVGQGVRQIWAASNLSQRRAILAEVLLAIRVLPKPHSAPRSFDPDYYVPVWSEDDSDGPGELETVEAQR
jgi:hypothetical protein